MQVRTTLLQSGVKSEGNSLVFNFENCRRFFNLNTVAVLGVSLLCSYSTVSC